MHTHEPHMIRQIPWLSLLIIALGFFLLPQQNSYAQRSFGELLPPKPTLPLPTPAPLAQRIVGTEDPTLSAQGVKVVDLTSGVTLYEKNPHQPLLPASTTKIMTAIVALERYQPTDEITVNTVLGDRPVMNLVHGEKISVENVIYGALVDSANDAAFALAEHNPAGVADFVAAMNDKAKRLGMTQTVYKNPMGFDEEGAYTTAADLAKLSEYALTIPLISKIAATPQITVSNTTFSIFHPLKNVNELLGRVPGVSGLKTGLTDGAGQCLVTRVNQNGHPVLIVILKSDDRFGETEKLINWVFSNFMWQTVGLSV